MDAKTERIQDSPDRRYRVIVSEHTVGWVVSRGKGQWVGYVNRAFGPGESRFVTTAPRLKDAAMDVGFEARRNRPATLYTTETGDRP